MDALAHPNWRYRIARNPVIVLGNHKSGTTAIAALLAKSTGLRLTYDVFYFVPRQPGVSLRDYAHANKRWFSAPINKAPEFTFMVPEVMELLPDAKYVFVM